MKKYITSMAILIAFLIINPALARGGDDSSGSGSSSSGSGSVSSDDSSSSGMETEIEHGVTTLKAHGGTDDSASGMEVETEHGVTFLKAHGGASNSSSISQGLSSFNMEVETEHGVTFLKPHGKNRDRNLENKLSGRIVLQVQANGEAWWIDPVTKARVFLGSPSAALMAIREHGLGISNDDLNKIARSDDNTSSRSSLARKLAGRILIQTEDHGKAWFVDPVSLKRFLLGRPQDAMNMMRRLGLGISDDNLDHVRLLLGETGKRQLKIALLEDSNSGLSGIAEIKEVNNQVKVEIMLFGTSTAGTVMPAHIHLGNRPNLGAVKYPLMNLVNGKSETTLNVSFDQLLSERPLGINIHKSPSEMSISVASGNL